MRARLKFRKGRLSPLRALQRQRVRDSSLVPEECGAERIRKANARPLVCPPSLYRSLNKKNRHTPTKQKHEAAAENPIEIRRLRMVFSALNSETQREGRETRGCCLEYLVWSSRGQYLVGEIPLGFTTSSKTRW